MGLIRQHQIRALDQSIHICFLFLPLRGYATEVVTKSGIRFAKLSWIIRITSLSLQATKRVPIACFPRHSRELFKEVSFSTFQIFVGKLKTGALCWYRSWHMIPLASAIHNCLEKAASVVFFFIISCFSQEFFFSHLDLCYLHKSWKAIHSL